MAIKKLSTLSGLVDYRATSGLYDYDLINISLSETPSLPTTSGDFSTSGWVSSKVTYGELESTILSAAPPFESPLPPGTILSFGTETEPEGWFECDGRELSGTLYPELSAALASKFDSTPTSGYFNIPDLRGEFIRGWANESSIDAGRALGENQLDVFKDHRHAVKSIYHSGSNYYLLHNNSDRFATAGGAESIDTTDYTEYYGNVTETRPRNVALMYCIKY